VRLLVLGGTLFLGRHLVDAAVARGHRVTTFTRGRTNPGPRDDVEALRGDRDGDLSALGGREWDAVVDTSAYRPAQASATARLLLNAVGSYCLISSASVYAEIPDGGAAESSALVGETGEVASYGALKVGCEHEVTGAFGERSLIVRPGVLCGPRDPTGRLSYWVHRIARGGDVLAPGDPMHLVQLLDARDLAQWLVAMLEAERGGVFNTSGPRSRITMDTLLRVIRATVATDADFIWAGDDFLLAEGVVPWSDLPFWLPRDAPGPLLDSRKAYAAGLTCRALEDTIRDVLADDTAIVQVDGGPPQPAPMSSAREAALLSRLREAV
jgi:2'-hydroxyisoflavone reductase